MLLILKGKEDVNATFHLPKGALVGTSSARRKSQLLHHCPHIELKDLRGNVPTRIQKLRDGGYDAIMMACAGAERLELDLSEFHIVRMDPKVFVPAPAQGRVGPCKFAMVGLNCNKRCPFFTTPQLPNGSRWSGEF
jgi:hydroxymethylbilane synthase